MIGHNKYSGFTLPELLITMGIVAILLSVAVPSISNMIKDNRLVKQHNSVVADVHFARSEASKRYTRVIMCRSGNPTATVPTCGGTANNWSSGYIIFADDGKYTNDVYNAGTDTLLRRSQPAIEGVNLRTSSRWDENLQFNPDGTTNEANLAAFMSLCDDRHETNGRQIQVMPNGIPKMFSTNISTCFP
jgi:type IV fimbrial biogenesis protein FimT